MTTVTVFRFRPGGYVGGSAIHSGVLDAARAAAGAARERSELTDTFVARSGGGLAVVATRAPGTNEPDVLRVASAVCEAAHAAAEQLGQHVDAYDPCALSVAELAFEERPSEPVLCFVSERASAGALDAVVYRVFGDPCSSPSLALDATASAGFVHEGVDAATGQCVAFALPDDMHTMLAAVAGGRFSVRRVVSRSTGEAAACVSSGEDPLMLVRCHGGFPGVDEVLEGFARPSSGPFWTSGVLMPVATTDDAPSRLRGPGRVVGLGFQICDGRLVGPRDLLADRAFDEARRQALAVAELVPPPRVASGRFPVPTS